MYSKIEITGQIELVTGMHIGGSSEFSAIGAVDSPVVRDAATNLPYIPGSSLKGKLRYLLSRKYNDRHIKDHSEDGQMITRLFGSSKTGSDGRINHSRCIFSDMVLMNKDELDKNLIPATEVKFENTINRATAIANPRQIERAVRKSRFPLSIIYNATDNTESLEDIKLLTEALSLLKYDFIGGHGSRGYGRIEFKNLEVECVSGDIESEIITEMKKLVEGV